ncbi:MAG TPA: hypothetical protein VKE88_02565, partial [Candidatus Nanoarchaeia archaeon]|nr:hypothetical protein [Candidatus Nanoarchaeia archaeon]
MIDIKQVQDLKNQGYSDEEITEAVREQEQQDELAYSYEQARQQQMSDPRGTGSQSQVGNALPMNSVEWQVELDSILERIEHMLRGDKPKFINGSVVYMAPENDEDKVLNDHGVSEVMRIATAYINRNTIFSNYEEEMINWKVKDFGSEINDLFFMKYDEFGLNTAEKRKRYPILVRELIDMVHSTYLRALGGEERRLVRSNINIQE